MNPKFHFFIAAGLFFVDEFFLGQGILSCAVGFVLAVVLFITAVIFLARQNRPKAVKSFINTGIYAFLIVAVVAFNAWNNYVAEKRLHQVVDACKQYKAKYKRFPDRLEDLVPEFFPKIPAPKLQPASWNKFTYLAPEPNDHEIMWVVLPPFGRMIYNLEMDTEYQGPD
jgi:hypothetical protein